VKAGRLSTRSADEIGLHTEAEQYDGEKNNQQGNQYTFSETFLSHVSNHIRHSHHEGTANGRRLSRNPSAEFVDRVALVSRDYQTVNDGRVPCRSAYRRESPLLASLDQTDSAAKIHPLK